MSGGASKLESPATVERKSSRSCVLEQQALDLIWPFPAMVVPVKLKWFPTRKWSKPQSNMAMSHIVDDENGSEEETASQSNLERLQSHLEEGGLARALLDAWLAGSQDGAISFMEIKAEGDVIRRNQLTRLRQLGNAAVRKVKECEIDVFAP
jgi:hypothetical protein